MAKYSEEQKINALALIESGEDLKEIVEKVNVAYPTLLRWRTELEEAKETGNIHNLVEVDALIVKRVADETKKELTNMASDSQDVAEIEHAVEGVLEGIDGYNLLNVKLQTVAMQLASRISALVEQNPGIGDLHMLIESLSILQNSFFNKNSTNVNILNNNQPVSNNTVSTFKAMKRA